MLNAILKGKAGRLDLGDGNSLSWRQVFRKREDLLTAVFFGRLRYLSSNGKNKILELLIGKNHTDAVGSIEDIEFWPKFSKEDGGFVEPDILIECTNATILIEVKPPFGGDQYTEQWEREIRCLINDRSANADRLEAPKVLHFVALGRNSKGWEAKAIKLEELFSENVLSIHAKEWMPIRDRIINLKLEEDGGQDGAVYEDWLNAFELFGIKKKLLSFTDMDQMHTLTGDLNILFAGWEPIK